MAIEKQKLVEEKMVVDERLGRLIAYINSPDFMQEDEFERGRIMSQRGIMESYSNVLRLRIEARP